MSTEADKSPQKPARPQLTENQQLALATDKNISVTAGAGSGKTTILVERYLRLILDEKQDVRKVLAITFTEKAAAEMKERVARMIRERLDSETDSQKRERLLELRERLSSAQISTIHAFCSRLLREYAVASGVDPDFSVPGDLQQNLLVQDAINDVFEALDKRTLDSDVSPEEWHELLRQLPPNELRRTLAMLLSQPYQSQQLQKKLAAESDEQMFEWLESQFFILLERHVGTAALLHDLLPIIREILSAKVERSRLKDGGKTAFQLFDEVLVNDASTASRLLLWQQLLTLSVLMTTNDATAYKRDLRPIGVKADLGEAFEPLKNLSQTIVPLAEFAKRFGENAPGDLDKLGLHNQRMVLKLYALANQIYRDRKEERGFLDFDDLQIYALQMLENHAAVRNDLRHRYSYIMVDEFQDTNDLQWDIISKMGIHDGQLDEKKFFVVGDPKQSIYGFRNADVRVFKSVKTQFAARNGSQNPADYAGNVVLQDSFRFLPGINNFTNFLFRQLIGTDLHNPFDVAYEPLATQRSAPDTAHIELAALNKKDLAARKLSQEDYIAQRICTLLNIPVQPESGETLPAPPPLHISKRVAGAEQPAPILPGDIAILIPRRTHLPELETTLRRYGVPFKTIGGVGFYRRQEIFDVYHLLRFLDNPADDLSLVALLRSPFAGISDAALFWLAQEKGKTWFGKLLNINDFGIYPEMDRRPLKRIQQQILRWQKRRDRLSLSRLVSEIFEESLYRATLAAEWNGEQMLANLDKLIEQIRDFEQSGFMALSDFIDSLRETLNLDPREGEAQIALEDESTVKIMTIHQSKGLEFPIVLLPYLSQQGKSNTAPYRFDAEWGLSAKWRNPLRNYEAEPPFLFNLIHERDKQKEFAEAKRLFYVAATRAKDQLYLTGTYENSDFAGETAFDWLARLFNLDATAGFAEQIPEFRIQPKEDVSLNVLTRIPNVQVAEVQRREILPALDAHSQTLDDVANGKLPQSELPVHLRKIDDSPKGVTFSATQLLTFNSDPDAYFLRYHRGFFESDYEFLTRFAEADALSLLKGKIVHKMLEDGLPADEGELLARLDDAFFQYEIFDEEERTDFRREIPALMLPFIASDTAQEIFGAAAFHNELSLTMRIADDFFTGTLDRVYQNGSGEWEVIDYKTNNIKAAEVQKTGEKYGMQMKGYALLLAQVFPEQTDYRVRLYFLKPQRMFEQVFSPADVDAIKNEFAGIIAQIKQFQPFGDKLPADRDENEHRA